MPESKTKKLIVYEVLKQRIITQAMKPGEPISEGILAQELEISTTPIREAIQQLEREGFIENIPGKGNFVSQISIQDLRELFEIREMLECEAIKRAAAKCDPQKLMEIRRAFELSREIPPNGSPREFRAGEHIHIFIFESLGNQRLLEIYRRLHDHIARHRHFFFSDVHEGRPEQSYREHLEILDALAAQDPARCEQAMRVHLKNSLEYVKSIL
jgi:GntR family transcriptional regulator, rspAB operon transcriptional repressor